MLISASAVRANAWILPNEVGRPPAPSKMIEAFNPFAPQVVVDSPVLADDGIASPVKVLVRFVPKNGAKIVVDSVRVFYVTFFSNIDITDRIRDKITAAGIRDEKAELPSGSHHLIIKVSDDRGLEVKKEFAVNVR